ncbi:class I SAM-dependent methyltransferase [Candidatus Symbiobacter mobilis]|uniref:Ubiquinone/menaquinone biosynthesis C-methyltransferase UbiE n=1 Tax=Candidatus Symbiobacter mobilis CR TaxID=946483 RepID=U5N4V1_9BURK|nr:class I SAM-dependent methyltransferase [Candidatus Symbiobacter mobilis]AGX86342.1 isoprenoid quinone biosynthesis methyltransferase [Candidatus Symbiobacter mobilis CR]
MADTHFGFRRVRDSDKAGYVRGVFDSVATRYDLMNDLMSLGLHRAWKACAVMLAQVQEGERVLDIAAGTGDLTRAFADKVGQSGQVVHTDINESMLRLGRDRLTDAGHWLPTVVCDAENLPFATGHFDVVCVAFGLRNMTHPDRALAEMHRVLRDGGRLLVLEFSRVWPPLRKAYDWYSFQVLPRLGQWVAHDASSYRYLAESIRMHPDQQALLERMHRSGFGHAHYHNLSFGTVAVHVGIKC